MGSPSLYINFQNFNSSGLEVKIEELTEEEGKDTLKDVMRLRVPFFDNTIFQALSNITYLTGNGPFHEGLIFHSDQGWQYQHESYQQKLKNKGIKQSMSRKGNSMDNGMMENFFGLLKTEMFYDQEDKYKTLDELILAIDDYINYYNYDRIKVKLKGLSPVNYRLQSSD